MNKKRKEMHDKFAKDMKKVTDMPNNSKQEIDLKVQLMKELHRQFMIDDKPFIADDQS